MILYPGSGSICGGEPGYEVKHFRSGTVESIIQLHNNMVLTLNGMNFLLIMSIEYASLDLAAWTCYKLYAVVLHKSSIKVVHFIYLY